MSTLQTLKSFIHQRLAVAVDEILGLLETTVNNYEEELQRQRKIIESERTELLHKNNTDTQQAMRFRVIIGQDIKKVTFENGIPFSVGDFTQVIKQAFSLGNNISLHYKDSDFDDFFTLTSTRDLKDKDTLKVIQLSGGPSSSAPNCKSERNSDEDVASVELPDLQIEETLSLNSKEQLTEDLQDQSPVNSDDNFPVISPNLNSKESQDHVHVAPSPFPSESRKLWPAVFPIPKFSYTTEIVLRGANDKFLKDGTLLAADNSNKLKSIKSDILERLAEAIISYTAYPNDAQRTVVCQALIEKHPCLREPGSVYGYCGWQNSLKFKFGNYRQKLKSRGSPEVLINSMKRKQDGEKYPNKNVKKPRKSEVNYLPAFPVGETVVSSEALRVKLIAAHKKRDSFQIINDMMSRTYSYRRQEVVTGSVKMVELKERWPALFDPVQINEEFKRCNTIPLVSTFVSQLDKYMPKFLTLFSSVGGALGHRLKTLWVELMQDTDASVVKKRDFVLRCLIEYMGEHVQDLVSDYCGISEEEVLEDLKLESVRIYICQQPDVVGVVINGTPVLSGLDSLGTACCLLLGLMYALNLDYPPALSKTFEIFQRLFVGMDPMIPRPSSKFINLKNRLLTNC